MKQVDIAIIGAGPAGLSAGIYAARAKRSVVILERAIPGGQQTLTDKIDNYPGTGKEGTSGVLLSQLMEEQAKSFGVEILSDNATGGQLKGRLKTVETTYNGTFEAKAVILATGRDPKPLGIPGEDEFRGRGVSYCAVCDGPFFRGKDVAVIGGGNSALEEALYLAKFARKVTLVHRRQEFRADKIVQERVKANSLISFELGFRPVEVLGKTVMESLVLEQVETGERKKLAVNAMFVYVGNHPNTLFFKEQVVCDDAGYLVADETMHTSVEGVFAAGDVRQKSLYQVVTAVADGAIAAIEADKYLDEVLW